MQYRSRRRYQYSIEIKDGKACLQIFNKDKSKMVQYEVSFDKKDNLVLKHPDMAEPLTLSY